MVAWMLGPLYASLKKISPTSLSVLLVVLLVASVFQGVPAGADESDDDQGTEESQQNQSVEADESGPRVIGSYTRKGESHVLSENHAEEHPQGLRVRAPPATTSMRIDPGFLADRLGPWSAAGPFDVGEDRMIVLDRRIGVFKELELGEESVFTLGSQNTIRFADRPMWVNQTVEQSGFSLGMEDGDSSGQSVFLSNDLLHEQGIHRPVVTHENGAELSVQAAEDGTGFWVEMPHFSEMFVEPDDFVVWERQGVITTSYDGDIDWNPETSDLFIEVTKKLTTYELLLEIDWFDANMPHVGLKTYKWQEEEYEGDMYYVVTLSARQTPTTLHFMDYRPMDEWVFTLGNPENLYIYPFDEIMQEELGPVRLKVAEDDFGVDIRVSPGSENDFELLVAGQWLESLVGESPVIERQGEGAQWVAAEEIPVLGGDYVVAHSSSTVFRVWDSLYGPLVSPDYEVFEEEVARLVDGCGSRHMILITNGSVIHDGPACLSTQLIFELYNGANETHWRYDASWGGHASAAMLCGMVVDKTLNGEIYWAGSACEDFVAPSGSAPVFLNDLCATVDWSDHAHEAFCGGGLTRYQAAGMGLGLEENLATAISDVVLYNDGVMDGMNQVLADEEMMAVLDWLEDLDSFSRTAGLDEPCRGENPVMLVGRVLPDSACGQVLEPNSDWDPLFSTRPCSSDDTTLAVLDGGPSAFCGDQLPIIREEVKQYLGSVDWASECVDRGFLLAGLGSGNNSSRVCGQGLENPDESLERVLVTTGIESQDVCYVDEQGTGQYDPGDGVYLSFGSCDGVVKENDLRLAHLDFSSGSKVEAQDSDEGAAYAERIDAPQFYFSDLSGDGEAGTSDVYYLCVGAPDPCGGTVNPGWVRVTDVVPAGEAGSVVVSGDDDVGANVSAEGLNTQVGEHFRYWDMAGDGTFNDQDVLYWATHGNTVNPSEGHIRLGALEGTGGFGEVLTLEMADTVDPLWYKVRSWGPCSLEVSFLLDPDDVPQILCGSSTQDIQEHLDSLLTDIRDQVAGHGHCDTQDRALLWVDPLYQDPTIVCAEVISSSDPDWQDHWSELVDLNPCAGELVLIDPGQLAEWELGEVQHQRLCGVDFMDVGASLNEVVAIVDECAIGETLTVGLSSVGLYRICGDSIDSSLPELGDVPNPCGVQFLVVPEDQVVWSSDRLGVCGVPVPDVKNLMSEALEKTPASCEMTGNLLRERASGELRICDMAPEYMPDSDVQSVFQLIPGVNPCGEDEDFVFGFDANGTAALCGGALANVVETAEGLVNPASLPCDKTFCDLIETLMAGCGEECDFVDEFGPLFGPLGDVSDDCSAIRTGLSSHVEGLMNCDALNRLGANILTSNPATPCVPDNGFECPNEPSDPEPYDILSNPFDILTIDPIGATLKWQGPGEGESGPRYTVFVDTEFPPRNIECLRSGEQQCGPLELKFGSLYFWQVKMFVDGEWVQGPIWSFITSDCSRSSGDDSGNWCPALREQTLFMEHAGNMKEEPLCRVMAEEAWDSSVFSSPETDPEENPYLQCRKRVVEVYEEEGPKFLVIREFSELFAPSQEESEPMGVHNISPASCTQTCNLVMLRGIASPIDDEDLMPKMGDPAKADYDAWRGDVSIRGHYWDLGYHVDLVDYYGGMCRANGNAADHGVDLASSGKHNYVHSHAHAEKSVECGTLLHDYRTGWRHLAYHVAWYIWDDYSSKGEPVDVVSHSMGGMIMRYALQQTTGDWPEVCETIDWESEDRCLWPRYLLVDNVVTLGTPHKGSTWSCLLMPSWVLANHPWWRFGNAYRTALDELRQIRELCRWSESVKDMGQSNAPSGGTASDADPESPTRWYLMGSDHDLTVFPRSSQTDMGGSHTVHYLAWAFCRSPPSHGEWPEETGTRFDACFIDEPLDGPLTTHDGDSKGPRAVNLSELLISGDWGGTTT